jgi:hypothetical protein
VARQLTSKTGNATFSQSFLGFGNLPPRSSGTVQAFLGGDRFTGGTPSSAAGEHYYALIPLVAFVFST